MNKETILKAMYEVIKESTEWGVHAQEYGMFVDGVVAMTDAMFVKIEVFEEQEDYTL